MVEFQIYRELDAPISQGDLDDAASESGRVLEEMREEGTDIQWNESEVLTNDEDDVIGTFCQYEAESEDAVEEHAERAGLPATTIARRGTPLEGE
ncbi:DUF4242 domain-containing protein [Halalkalicoccus subterraneus]|uniref:DUF4242 domain-containing protein n=1 Tax=Halalkalicoccus subterraneus TaxID=2675002 RepID=UPI000EFA7211|nr:DUF4242 domain-containing protein [Halalkalicoccus subterraneus]